MSWLQRFDAFLAREGSTRLYGFARVAFACLIWAEYANKWTLFRSHAWDRQLFAVYMMVSVFGMLLGVWSRVTTAMTAAGLLVAYYYWGVHLGMKGAYVHAHSYLLCMSVCCLALAPNDRSLSLDRYWRVAKAEAAGQPPPPEHGLLWPLWLIRFQLAMVYLWGAVDKTNWAFLSGARLQQIFYSYFGSHEGMRIPGFDALMTLSGIGTVVFEYAIVVGLLHPLGRRWLIPVGLLFHGTVYMTLPVGTFSMIIFVLYVLHYPPQRFHRFVDQMLGVTSPDPSCAAEAAPSASPSPGGGSPA